MTTVEVLRAAKELIADRSRWCQEMYSTPGGDAWCAVGAFYVCGGTDSKWLTEAAFDIYNTTAEEVNDRMGHQYVMSIYDRAIELAQEAEHGAGMVDEQRQRTQPGECSG
jgi:hypothetical protein